MLEHKIEELRQQILPKEGVIMDLRSQIEAMEDELVTSNLNLSLDLSWTGFLKVLRSKYARQLLNGNIWQESLRIVLNFNSHIFFFGGGGGGIK